MARTIQVLFAIFGLGLTQATRTPVVDLGYARYQGFYHPTYDLDVFRGIRYAAPPVGDLRWQMPQPPARNRSQILPAVDYAPQCPQSPAGSGYVDLICCIFILHTNDTPSLVSGPPTAPSGDEDCLFLNVEAPANKTGLPVLVWILILTRLDGGGYGQGNNQFELAEQIRTNGNSYIAVSIAYRLGAFGFLSSAEVRRFGVVNAAIHDMRFALQWVKKNIHRFGGDPDQVTVAGESAGGGSTMLLAMANGGTEGDALFKGVIASSPYLPTQWDFDDAWPTLSYQAFVDEAGCSDAEVALECLQSADTAVLQNASARVSVSSNYGQWAFIPVTDGALIRDRPTRQLAIQKRVNGLRVLTGNNENEAGLFTPQNITSKDDFIGFVLTKYPRLGEENITRILDLYAVPENSSQIYADSDGLTPPFSTTNSNWAVGWQQAANNLYAETTFVCPSYWMADAFAGSRRGKGSWKYQFSVPISSHGADVGPLSADPKTPGTGMDEVFRTAFQRIWGNFVTKGDPTLSTEQVDTAIPGNITAASIGNWPRWGECPARASLLNINMTGGVPVVTPSPIGGKTLQLTSYVPDNTGGSGPSLEAAFNLASGWSWEGGRGKRCQLWVDLGRWALE
ncbi:carboxylesterase [Nemania sp. NC0429]|nr:carboxylesterase [Nemania sp. NC0429]